MTDESHAVWAEEDGSVIGYMCRIDWECEIGGASGGNCVYASVDDLKKHRSCVESCGIVEVAVSFRRVVEVGKGHDE